MNVAIITFHGAHNYGAVLQAYALQQFISLRGIKCEIINYRPVLQKNFNSLYPRRDIVKSIVKNMLLLPYDAKRRNRGNKFECFINQKLSLTANEYISEKKLNELNNYVDVFIVGSDQVWNTTHKAGISNAYFLEFVNDNKIKIAYAASIGHAREENLSDYVSLIKRFDAISCRENRAVHIISKLLGRSIPLVLDPTLLVDNGVFDLLVNNINLEFEDYIFYYSLDGYGKRKNNVEELRMLGKKLKKKVVVLTPEWPKKEKDFINVIDIGPTEFLSLIKHSALVCTNSFHGTALSISFKKDFYVLDQYDEVDDRKVSLLKQLNLENRLLKGRNNIDKINMESVDYTEVYKKLNIMKKNSEIFLVSSIFENVPK